MKIIFIMPLALMAPRRHRQLQQICMPAIGGSAVAEADGGEGSTVGHCRSHRAPFHTQQAPRLEAPAPPKCSTRQTVAAAERATAAGARVPGCDPATTYHPRAEGCSCDGGSVPSRARLSPAEAPASPPSPNPIQSSPFARHTSQQ